MSLSASIPFLKSQAKRLKRALAIPLSEALNRIARQEGYATWSLLVARESVEKGIEPFARLDPGDLLLIGARPRHGKTLYALQLLIHTMRRGRRGWFFSLQNDTPNLGALFESLGERPGAFSEKFILDASDDICAAYIIRQVQALVVERSVLVIDYLQLLDQRRTSPELQAQVQELRAFARQTGCIVVFIAQIHRSFDAQARALPSAEDLRLPNALDLSLFDKSLFLHQGQSRLDVSAA